MSQLPPDVVENLQQLLAGLESSDNRIRTQAEDSLNNEWISGRPDMLLSGLAEQVRWAEAPGVSLSLLPHFISPT
jgi:importin-5